MVTADSLRLDHDPPAHALKIKTMIAGAIAAVLVVSCVVVYNRTSMQNHKRWAFGMGTAATIMTGLVSSDFERQSVPFSAGVISSIILVYIIVSDDPEANAQSATDEPGGSDGSGTGGNDGTDDRYIGCLLVAVIVAALISLSRRCATMYPLTDVAHRVYGHASRAASLAVDHTRAAALRGKQRLNVMGSAVSDAYNQDLS